MNCIAYRIKHIPALGYWPQVKDGFKWKRIAKHPTGYGLYDENDLDYPKTKEQAQEIINAYDKYIKTDLTPIYEPTTPKQ
jgi:hypothetical protein